MDVNLDLVLARIQQALPAAMAVYGFGSHWHGTASARSDLDLAVLVAGYADPLQLFSLSQTLATLCHCEVDLVDLRAASTVLQHQILTTGQRLWRRDYQADMFEAAVLNDKLSLDEARAGLLQDIQRRGTVY